MWIQSCIKELHRAMSERVSVHFEFLSTSDDYWYEVVAYPYDKEYLLSLKKHNEKKEI